MAEYELIPLSRIREDPDQPRRVMDDDAISEMAATMRTIGVIEPLVVQPEGDGFKLIVGHRRRRAAEVAGLREVPCVVRHDVNELEVMRIQAVEDVQNEELDPRDRYAFWARLWEAEKKANPSMTMAQFAGDVIGRSPTYVSAGIDVAQRAPAGLRDILGDPAQGRLHPTYARYLVKDRSLSDDERVAVGRKIAAGELPAGGGRIGTETLKVIRSAPPKVRDRLIAEPGYTLEHARWELRHEERQQVAVRARRDRTVTPSQLAMRFLRATLDFHNTIDPGIASFFPEEAKEEIDLRLENLMERIDDFRLALQAKAPVDQEVLDAIDATALEALLAQEVGDDA